ncbi:hypothetical protein DFH28DRAFT_931061 [Melampsora americana]|nr:hypothetical protein DFH28DRAFT_931061 [Melampsora americana]
MANQLPPPPIMDSSNLPNNTPATPFHNVNPDLWSVPHPLTSPAAAQPLPSVTQSSVPLTPSKTTPPAEEPKKPCCCWKKTSKKGPASSKSRNVNMVLTNIMKQIN